MLIQRCGKVIWRCRSETGTLTCHDGRVFSISQKITILGDGNIWLTQIPSVPLDGSRGLPSSDDVFMKLFKACGTWPRRWLGGDSNSGSSKSRQSGDSAFFIVRRRKEAKYSKKFFSKDEFWKFPGIEYSISL
jgi:hypothetical protein